MPAKDAEHTVWLIDNLESIDGHEIEVVGSPALIETPAGKAGEFDGEGDARFVDVHPLAGLEVFTVEVIFRPYADGLKEQRFFHMQEDGSDDRVLFETRLTGDNQWFLDTFIRSGEGSYVLFAEDFKHPIGPWYHAAIVMDDEKVRHYVNGELELEKEIDFTPHTQGRTSLGVRINTVHWYKGAMSKARFTSGILSPEEFLKP